MIWPPSSATLSSFPFHCLIEKKSFSVFLVFVLKPPILEKDMTWCRIGAMCVACDERFCTLQGATAVAAAVPASGGGWDKEFVTGVPSHMVHKEAAQCAVSYFGPSGVGGGCSGLCDGL